MRSGIIEDLESKKNIVILVINEKFSRNWQLPVKVVEHIKETYEKVDEIDVFDIYVK
ncbi:MAG: hypothetical protein HFJ54_00935 [Clostridia bacterium]|nr:hypothetical protein [Clostridia bacterium]